MVVLIGDVFAVDGAQLLHCPSVEPWDTRLLAKSSAKEEYNIDETKLDALVEHPAPVILATRGDTVVNMYLTPQERKKLRRRKRQEREREKQDKIRMGLLPPPPPKCKLSNLMRVLGDVAVADPSKTEKRVREQMAARLEGHENRNQERKLTKEEKTKKTINKWRLKQQNTCSVAVFRVRSLANKRHLFKVDTNARQFHVTGVCVIAPPPLWNVVVFEGSHRSIKRLRALMERRIKWKDAEGGNDAHTKGQPDESEEEAEEGDTQPDECCLCWLVRCQPFR
ncbi:u4 u6 small nuclear protein [Cyclospora cayetanensis]|uniref:U4 u6 small nuclear protein n=1 Tax=Cyclospora cayetanensis TaxID=88456 RepID=A0A1D3CX88_9EIME|nr:u4 u6 small nuclear protein [Cyclospora cayetanensis]